MAIKPKRLDGLTDDDLSSNEDGLPDIGGIDLSDRGIPKTVQLSDDADDSDDVDEPDDDDDDSDDDDDLSVVGDDDDGDDDGDDDLGVGIKPRRFDKSAKGRISDLTSDVNQAGEVIQTLSTQIESLTASVSSMHKKEFDNALVGLDADVVQTKKDLVKAKRDDDAEGEVELQERLSDLKALQTQFHAQRANAEKNAGQPAARPTGMQTPEGKSWMGKNGHWFRQAGFKRETALAYAIDAELTEEGMTPQTRGYYKELSKRLKEALGKPPKNSSSRKSGQSPVNGTKPKNGTKNKNPRKHTFDQDEIDIAKGLGFAGNPELMKTYAKNLRRQQAT